MSSTTGSSSSTTIIMDFIMTYWNQISDNSTNYIRPTIIIVCAMLLFNLPTVIYKVRMLITAVLYFIFCWDKSFTKPIDPGSIFGPHLSQGLPVERKTIYFIRHAESTWNETFNKGSHRTWIVFLLSFIPGLIKSILYEIFLLLSGKLDSWFYDSPLSSFGLSQVEEMAAFLKDKPLEDSIDPQAALHIKILRGDVGVPKSKMICSNLRRAVSTLAYGFQDRLINRRPNDKILIVPCLQEVSRNPDTLSLTPPHTPIQASWIEKGMSHTCDFQSIFNNHIDMSLHGGNKPIDTNGIKRMDEFCEFIFSKQLSEEYIIVGGHSIWFKYFFTYYLPYSVHHVSKNKKIINCGIITFDLLKAETRRGPKYMIDPKTIKTVYGGF